MLGHILIMIIIELGVPKYVSMFVFNLLVRISSLLDGIEIRFQYILIQECSIVNLVWLIIT